MFLAPDGDEVEIAGAAASFLDDALPIARLHAGGRDMDGALRATIAGMGWFALAVPEERGGSGLSAVEFALFFREAGRRCGPVDLLAQSLAAHVGDDDAVRAGILSGADGVALAVRDRSGLRLFGSPDARYALVTDGDGAALVAIDGAGEERPALDPVNSMRLAGGGGREIARRDDGLVWRLGRLGTAAMLVGLAEAALDLIVDYAKVRETFGRKIGSYQAVRHPCADMALRVEAARCQLWYAAAAMKEERGDADVHLDAAKHLANQAAAANADTCMQLHGGIGVTDEHDAHLLLKHALLLGKLFGSRRPLLARLLTARVED